MKDTTPPEPSGDPPYLASMEWKGFSPERARAALEEMVHTGAVHQEGSGRYTQRGLAPPWGGGAT